MYRISHQTNVLFQTHNSPCAYVHNRVSHPEWCRRQDIIYNIITYLHSLDLSEGKDPYAIIGHTGSLLGTLTGCCVNSV